MLFVDYILWHYSVAPRQILVLLKNFSRATWHKFMIVQHFKTLFAPWHRMLANYMFPPKNFADKLGNWVVDMYIRLIAALIRSTIILTGLAVQAIAVIFFITLFIVWLLWPLVFLALLSRGFHLIIT